MTAEARLLVLERVGDDRATDAHMRAGADRRGLRGINRRRRLRYTFITPLDGDALVAIESKEDK